MPGKKRPEPTSVAKQPKQADRVYSIPTMCLHCHLLVEFYHTRGADPVKGEWVCPQCDHRYLFSHWKIKRAQRGGKEPT